jgi:hypothetical protein
MLFRLQSQSAENLRYILYAFSPASFNGIGNSRSCKFHRQREFSLLQISPTKEISAPANFTDRGNSRSCKFPSAEGISAPANFTDRGNSSPHN